MFLRVFGFYAAILALSGSSATADLVEICILDGGQQGKCSTISECEQIHLVKENWGIGNCREEYSVCCPAPKHKRSLPKNLENFVFQEKREDKTESTAKKWCNYYKSACPCSRMPDGAGGFIGGVSANPYELPHMAAIGYGPQDDIVWQCGGSLISENYVLTAAHCLNDGRHPAAWVSLGTVIIQDKIRENVNVSVKGQTHPVLDRIVHPDYKSPEKYNDIALLKIGTALESDSISTLNDKIHPACLQISSVLPYDITSSGWGRLGPFEDPTPFLQKGFLNIYDSSECNKTFELEIRTTNLLQKGIHDSQVCAGRIEGGVDTCQGDSGGPLQSHGHEGSCLIVVVGVTSFGKICGQKNNLGVYTRVTYYLDWIEEIVWKNRIICLVDDENYGECLPLSKCTHIHEHVRRGYRPAPCGYDREEPIVCCPSPYQEIWIPPPRMSSQPAKSRAPGEAAKLWCEKYKQEFKNSRNFQENLPKERKHFPHLAFVGYGELKSIYWQCAGSLISEKFVLIAAHCLLNDKCKPAKWIKLGTQTFKSTVRWTSENNTVIGQVHPVTRVAVHPGYKESPRENDLALILIGDPIESDASSTMSAYIHPACLQVSVKQIQEAQLVGANSWERGDHLEYNVEEADVNMTYITSCSLNPEESMKEKEVFSACRTTCKEYCNPAHQGSLQILIDQDALLYEVLGLQSLSETIGFLNISLVFTPVLPYLSWIEDYVWPA